MRAPVCGSWWVSIPRRRSSRPPPFAMGSCRAPWVVVRRLCTPAGLIPVGVCGLTRGEHFAALLARNAITERVTTEDLAAARSWRHVPRARWVGSLQVLHAVDELFTSLGFTWGPTGSVGFELATGVAAAGPASDLDVVVRAPEARSGSALSKGTAVRPSREDRSLATDREPAARPAQSRRESIQLASIVRYSKGGASWRGCRGSPPGRGVVRWRDSSSGSSSVSSGTGEPSALWSVASLEKTLAGFIIPFGSSARLMARIASSAGPCSRAMYGARAAPTPCSPVTVPPILSASS